MIETYDIKRPLWQERRTWMATPIVVVVAVSVFFWYQTRPPADFPVGSPVTIQRGLSAGAIADLLDEQAVVRSGSLLYFLLVWLYDPNNIQAGTYVFQDPLNVSEVAKRLSTPPGAGHLLAITLPEGFTSAEFAKIAAQSVPGLDVETFEELGKSSEGRLFPDTYYLPADFTADELHALLLATYEEKTEDIRFELTSHRLKERGVLILASLIEREANDEESMRMVAGILENRLNEGMRLQVDASLEYVLGRPLGTLTASDLEIDTPYNTYLYGGLPPTPIGNPGLQAIKAVLDPIKSDYFYYITDTEGVFHYAKTFDEHKRNIAKYLK